MKESCFKHSFAQPQKANTTWCYILWKNSKHRVKIDKCNFKIYSWGVVTPPAHNTLEDLHQHRHHHQLVDSFQWCHLIAAKRMAQLYVLRLILASLCAFPSHPPSSLATGPQ